MKKMRIPLTIALCITVLGIVLGSFFDLQISQAIASPTNKAGLFFSALGPTISFAAVAVCGGGFVAFALKGDYPKWLKVIFYILAAACLGVSIYYPGKEWFGINGFYKAAPEIIGYLIVLVPECAAMVGGYFLFRNNQNKNMWIVFVAMIVMLCVVLLGFITILKGIMHRPRFRFLSNTDLALFHNWWEPCKNYESLMEQYKDLYSSVKELKENFKSFPSGHTAEASIFVVPVVFLPLSNKKFEKYQLPLFICGICLVLLVAFARILAAAHFLSDVSMGATLMLLTLFVTNEIIMRVKIVQPVKEEQVTENE